MGLKESSTKPHWALEQEDWGAVREDRLWQEALNSEERLRTFNHGVFVV